jgi:hypothetical protein
MEVEVIVASVKERLDKPRRYQSYEVYRTRQFSRMILVILSPSLVVPFLIPFELADASVAPWRRVLAAALMGLLSWGLLVLLERTAWAGVYVRGDEVVIRNRGGTERLSMDEIGRFAEFSGNRGSSIGAVELTDGRRVLIHGIQGQYPDLWPNSTWASAPIEQLNQLLADRRGAKFDDVQLRTPSAGMGPASIEDLRRSFRAHKIRFAASFATYLSSAAVIFAFRSPVIGIFVLAVGIIGLPLGWRTVRASYQRQLGEARQRRHG